MQEAVKPKPRRKYDRTGEPADFKTDVLKMRANGQSATYVAKALGISENLIYSWKSKNQMGKKIATATPEVVAENHQLKERVRQLETERDILKKALGIFSVADQAGRPDVVLRLGC